MMVMAPDVSVTRRATFAGLLLPLAPVAAPRLELIAWAHVAAVLPVYRAARQRDWPAKQQQWLDGLGECIAEFCHAVGPHTYPFIDPLSCINGYAEILAERLPADDALHGQLNGVMYSGIQCSRDLYDAYMQAKAAA